MSDYGSEKIMSSAKAMGEEEMKIFLTQVDRKLLIAEINNRLERAEKRDSALEKLVGSYEKRNDWEQNGKRFWMAGREPGDRTRMF